MAKNLTPAEVAQKQVRNGQAGLEAAKLGIQRTSKKPMQLAKEAIPKMKQNFNRSVDDGTVAAGFDSVSDAEWKERAISGFDANYSSGLERSLPRQIEFQEARSAFINQTQAAIDRMPTMTEAEKDAKMLANRKRMSQFKYRRRLKR